MRSRRRWRLLRKSLPRRAFWENIVGTLNFLFSFCRHAPWSMHAVCAGRYIGCIHPTAPYPKWQTQTNLGWVLVDLP